MADEAQLSQQAERPPLAMSTEISNSIITRAPLSQEQLNCAIRHYAALEAQLRISGPRFTNSRRDAADMHNKALILLEEAQRAASGEFEPPRRVPLQA